MKLRSGDKHHLRKFADRKAQVSPVSGTNAFLNFVLFDLQIFPAGVYPPSATSRTSSFSISIVFGINFIHFFDEKKPGSCRRKFDRLFRCFDPLSCHFTEATKNANCFEECNVFTCNGSVNSAPFKRGVRERGANFLQGKVQNSSPILRCTFWQGKVQISSPISALLR